MHVREFAYVRACEHNCHRMRVCTMCASTCVCVCLCGCAHGNVFVCASVCVYLCYAYAYTCACICACACVFMSAFVGVCANQIRVRAGVRIWGKSGRVDAFGGFIF